MNDSPIRQNARDPQPEIEPVLWIDIHKVIEVCGNLPAKSVGMVIALASHICLEGPVLINDVRGVLGLTKGERGLPLNKLGGLFVVSDSLIELNDYAFVADARQGGVL